MSFIKLKTKFNRRKINLDSAYKDLRRQAEVALRGAALDYIQAATSVIPVWSGASHATFTALAKDIGAVLDIKPVFNAPDRRDMGEFATDTGLRLTKDGKFSFVYETKLEHLLYNEENNANINPDPRLFGRLITPGPYGFFPLARAAANDALKGFRFRVSMRRISKTTRLK